MKRRYKIKERNKTKLKSYLKGKSNNTTNERNTRQCTGRNR